MFDAWCLLIQAPQLVKGPGVVGQQPVLEPGQSFEYSSACPITCAPKEGYQVSGGRKGWVSRSVRGCFCDILGLGDNVPVETID